MTTVLWVAIAVVLGQGAVMVALLVVIRTFGAYTNVVLQTHQQNMLIQQENWNITQDNAHLRAQLLAERRPHPPQQPPLSEECVA